MDKFIIKNKSGTILSINIGRNNLRMNPNDQIDLCLITGMGADEIERHPQVIRNAAYNNISIIEKYKYNKTSEVSDLSKKIEKLMEIVSEKNPTHSGITKNDLVEALKEINVVNESQPANTRKKENIVSEDDRLRQELLIRQADSFNPDIKNTGTFGKNTQSIDVEDMSSLLGDLED